MSVQRYKCGECSRVFETGPIAGSFCSTSCHERHERRKRARELLRLLEFDHRFCLTCGRQLKEIERPTDEQLRSIDGLHSATALIGIEFETEHAEHGLKTDPTLFERGEDPDPYDARRRAREGIICSCGATSHSTVSEEIRESLSPAQIGRRLLEAIGQLRLEGKHEVDVDGVALVTGLETGRGVREALIDAVVQDDQG